MGDDLTGGPRSRRDRGMTALIEGFFGFVWFGWGQANASSGLRVGLAVAGVVALRGRRGASLPLRVAAGGPAARDLAAQFTQATRRLVGTCGRSVAALVHRRRHPGGADCGRCR